ncbi:MAG: CoA transferase [Burkholderiales bacterium]|nr:CoA transferase [Burkholderiales bacterium]
MSKALDTLPDEFPPYQPRPAGAPRALDGVRVIDFTHFIAGPLATMMLADMGADVIKIEPPARGDELRYYPPVLPELPERGAPFFWANRSKRSLALDLKKPEAVEVARELIRGADIVIENFSAGVMQRLGLGYDVCRALNPGVVFCAVSAYGREGPYADRLGFDPIAQAESGFVAMNGYPDRQGVRASSAVMDISTAMMVGNAVLGALYARQRLGEGQYVEVGLFDTALLMTGWASMQHLMTGMPHKRHGNTSIDTCPSGVFQSQDQAFYINCGNDKIFNRLALQVLERPDLADDPVLADRNGRLARQEELFRTLDEIFATQPWAYWQERMRAAQIPCGEVRSVGQALRSPEARARDLVSWIAHPEVGQVPNIASPIRFARTPVVDPTPAPNIGQHSVEILREVLGYDDARIAALAAVGVFGQRVCAEAEAAPAAGRAER